MREKEKFTLSYVRRRKVFFIDTFDEVMFISSTLPKPGIRYRKRPIRKKRRKTKSSYLM